MGTSKGFSSWYSGLTDSEKTSYARRAKTSRRYIETHLLTAGRIPRPHAMHHLARASGTFTLGGLCEWFYRTKLANARARTIQ